MPTVGRKPAVRAHCGLPDGEVSIPLRPAQHRDGNAVPLFALGFRPFYLLAGLFAAGAIGLWLAVYAGEVTVMGYLSGVAWHRHEMIFGFAAAVIAGFLLTAVRNWTGRPTPNGMALAALAVLWLLGRILILTGPAPVAAIVDVAFLPVLAFAIALPIVRAANARNMKLIVVLAGLTLANAAYHLSANGVFAAEWMSTATLAALDFIAILIAIMGGRVIPAFTTNAVRDANPRILFPVEAAAIGTLVIIILADVAAAWLPIPPTIRVTLLTAASVVHAVRLILWQPLRTRSQALLWMLPLAYAWLPVALALRALAHAGLVAPTAGVHALTLGAMSALMLAMMMRSALGHTGRPLQAGAVEIAAFVLIQLATLIRVTATFASPAYYRELVLASGGMWACAFLLFVLRYGPWLCQRRADGQPG